MISSILLICLFGSAVNGAALPYGFARGIEGGVDPLFDEAYPSTVNYPFWHRYLRFPHLYAPEHRIFWNHFMHEGYLRDYPIGYEHEITPYSYPFIHKLLPGMYEKFLPKVYSPEHMIYRNLFWNKFMHSGLRDYPIGYEHEITPYSYPFIHKLFPGMYEKFLPKVYSPENMIYRNLFWDKFMHSGYLRDYPIGYEHEITPYSYPFIRKLFPGIYEKFLPKVYSPEHMIYRNLFWNKFMHSGYLRDYPIGYESEITPYSYPFIHKLFPGMYEKFLPKVYSPEYMIYRNLYHPYMPLLRYPFMHSRIIPRIPYLPTLYNELTTLPVVKTPVVTETPVVIPEITEVPVVSEAPVAVL